MIQMIMIDLRKISIIKYLPSQKCVQTRIMPISQDFLAAIKYSDAWIIKQLWVVSWERWFRKASDTVEKVMTFD